VNAEDNKIASRDGDRSPCISKTLIFLIHHRENRGHRERNVRRCVAPPEVQRSLSVLFSVLSVPLWFLLREMILSVCPNAAREA